MNIIFLIGKNSFFCEKRKITTHRGNAKTKLSLYICGSCMHSLQDESIACDGCKMWFDLECQSLAS